MMTRDSSAASSKRRKPPTAMAAEDDHADGGHPPAAAAAATAAASSGASVWTEEMHSSFLHRMEAAFVHNILFSLPSAGHAAAANNGHLTSTATTTTATETETTAPRLDRYVPDSSESTLDGHGGDAPPAPACASGARRSRGSKNARRNGCTAGGKLATDLLSPSATQADISLLPDREKATSTSRERPLSGLPKESDDDGDQNSKNSDTGAGQRGGADI